MIFYFCSTFRNCMCMFTSCVSSSVCSYPPPLHVSCVMKILWLLMLKCLRISVELYRACVYIQKVIQKVYVFILLVNVLGFWLFNDTFQKKNDNCNVLWYVHVNVFAKNLFIEMCYMCFVLSIMWPAWLPTEMGQDWCVRRKRKRTTGSCCPCGPGFRVFPSR